MSQEKNTQEQDFIYGLTRKVMAVFNLGDGGKVDNFISKLVKDFERSITKNNQTLAIKASAHEDKLYQFNEQLEDAKQELEDAWMNIPVEKVANNDAQNHYKAEYLSKIEAIEQTIESLNNSRKSTIEAYEKEVVAIEKAINACQDRIKTIKSL